MRDIPRAEWDTFLDVFTREHRNQPVTVAKSDVRDGLRIAERATPLLGLRYDPAAHRISITVDEPPAGEVTHTILEPESVAVEEPAEADESPSILPAAGSTWSCGSNASRFIRRAVGLRRRDTTDGFGQ